MQEQFQRDFLQCVDPRRNITDINTKGDDWLSSEHGGDWSSKSAARIGMSTVQTNAEQDIVELQEQTRKLEQQIENFKMDRDREKNALLEDIRTCESKLSDANEELKTRKADLYDREREIAQQRERISVLTLEKQEAIKR